MGELAAMETLIWHGNLQTSAGDVLNMVSGSMAGSWWGLSDLRRKTRFVISLLRNVLKLGRESESLPVYTQQSRVAMSAAHGLRDEKHSIDIAAATGNHHKPSFGGACRA